MKQRKNECVGGGWLVFRRGKRTGRIGVKSPGLPFEHPTQMAAQQEAIRLAKAYPGETFSVFHEDGFLVRADVEDPSVEDSMLTFHLDNKMDPGVFEKTEDIASPVEA